MKKYSLEVIISDDGKLSVNTKNDGFSIFELIGILDWKKRDIENQLANKVKPDTVLRKVIEE